MVLEKLLWRVTCPNHARFHSLTVARKGSCGPTKKLILLRTQSVVFCSLLQVGGAKKFSQALGFENLDPFYRVGKPSPCFIATEEAGGDRRLVELEPACQADGIALPNPV